MNKSLNNILRPLQFFVDRISTSTWKSYGATQLGRCFLLSKPVPPGWYLLRISYVSSDARVFVRFRSGLAGFCQGLVVRPWIDRIRVVHLSRLSQPMLELESEDPFLSIRTLRLRRISSCQAWQLIAKKLKRSHPRYQELAQPLLGVMAWRDYNRLQNGRFHHSPLASYRDWLRIVEPKLPLLMFQHQDHSGQSEVVFLYQSLESGEVYSPVPLGTWVIPMVPSMITAANAEDILSMLILSNPGCRLIYTDYDRMGLLGTRYGPNFKPALNLDLALSDPLYSIGCVVRADLWNQAVASLSRVSSSHSAYGLFLEALYLTSLCEVIHLPHILFHLRDQVDETQTGFTQLRATDESIRTVKNFCEAHHPGTIVEVNLVQSGRWGQRVTWPLPEHSILVSILIPTRDAFQLLSSCVSSLLTIPAGVKYELIIVDNGSVDPRAVAFIDDLRCRNDVIVLTDHRPFNYSSLVNTAALSAKGDILCLLNNDTEVITPNWLAKLAAHAIRPEIGCVGPMLLYADNTVQHGGVVLGIGGLAGHAHKYLKSSASGFQARLHLCQNFSAVTGACLLVRSSLWRDMGGLDETYLAVNYNDVDFCLRVASAGFRNLYVPSVQLYHYESKSRGAPVGDAYQQWQQERGVMLKRWGEIISSDPAYSPHLSLSSEDFSLSLRVVNVDLRTGMLPRPLS